MCVPGWDEKARGQGCPVAVGAIAGGPEPRRFYGTGCPQDEAPWMGKAESDALFASLFGLLPRTGERREGHGCPRTLNKKRPAAGTVDPKKFEE